ncbi:MAG TPA: OmpA family protein [Terriglobales bacterium]|nr:OmpA family protein [Terriglobales bacterium]
MLPTGKIRVLAFSLLILSLIAFASVAGQAQDENTPKADIFVGYQWLNPGGSIPVAGTANPVQGRQLQSLSKGFGLAFGYNFYPVFALEGDLGRNWDTGLSFTTYSVGPRFTLRSEGVNFFAHTLLSLNQLTAPGFSTKEGIGTILGGGMDLRLGQHVSIRLIEADYQWARHNFAPLAPENQSNLRRPSFSGTRLRGGLVFNLGGGAPSEAPTAQCTAQPAEVMVGEPVTVNLTTNNFNPKHTLNYSWTSTGGKITGKDTTASIDTNGIAGGSYTATAQVTDPKAKKNNQATCSANFTVKEPPKNPPTMSCSANPSTLQAGGTVSISCDCTSPDKVQVNVAGWNTSAGTVSGSGNTGTLNTTGAAPGPITVSATCTDSRGLNSSATTQVTIETPPAPSPQEKELEARLALHSIYFPTAQPTVANPKGGLVTSQQKTLLALATDFVKYLQSKPDAKLILEGHADPRGSAAFNQALSERRVERTRAFLVENGVPAGNIETKAFGAQHNLTPAEVRGSVEQNPELTPGERQRILRNMRTIILASNRRVDVTLSTTGQTSVRQFPFNAADSLSLIGGRETKAAAPARKAAPRPKARKKTKK